MVERERIEPIPIQDYRCEVCNNIYKVTYEEAVKHCNQPVEDFVIPVKFIWRNLGREKGFSGRRGAYCFIKENSGLDEEHKYVYNVDLVIFKTKDREEMGGKPYPFKLKLDTLRNYFETNHYALVSGTDRQFGTKKIVGKKDSFQKTVITFPGIENLVGH
jgi:hypothetical protein